MNVSPVSSSTSGISGNGTLAGQLQKEITNVTTEITDETNSKDDSKTKALKIQVYQEELLALQQQLQQLQQKQQVAQSAASKDASSSENETPAGAATAPINDGTGRNLNTFA